MPKKSLQWTLVVAMFGVAIFGVAIGFLILTNLSPINRLKLGLIIDGVWPEIDHMEVRDNNGSWVTVK